MRKIVITGIDGAIARHYATSMLAEDPTRRVSLLGEPQGYADPRAEKAAVDLLNDDLVSHIDGADAVVVVVGALIARLGCTNAVAAARRIIEASHQAAFGPRRMIVVSSAVVYGARCDNPIPFTEAHPRRPLAESPYACAFAAVEEAAEWWSATTGGELALVRPAVTLAPGEVDPMAARLRAATSRRPDQLDPPVQFLHVDDLVRALCLLTNVSEVGVFNVAPAGWIDPEPFAALVSEDFFRVPRPVGELNLVLTDLVPSSGPTAGAEQYVAHPWVINNDRLLSLGWTPKVSNEEAYVLGNPTPLWRRVTQGRRHELTLGALGLVGAVGVAGLGVVVKSLPRWRL